MINDSNIQQLVSYLSGNCSKNEQKLVEEWIYMSTENKLLFDEFKLVWDHSSLSTDSCFADVNKSWNKFTDLTGFNENAELENTKVTPVFNIRSLLYNTVRIAALIVIVLGLYWVFSTDKSIKTINYTSGIDSPDSPFTLPDGSVITMNKGAVIDYPEYFASDIRRVNFVGEAFFEVKSNPEKPMVIEMGNIRVKVLGTSFNLCNCSQTDDITVYLETGKILFYSVNETDGSILEQIILSPGQVGVYNKNSGQITKHIFTDNNHLAWKTGALEFVNAPLKDVIRVLERTYKVEINADTSLDNYLLTARFNNETTESIFESLQIIYGFNFEINDDGILIY